MKRFLSVFFMSLLLFVFSESAFADLQVIGSATYRGNDYNLIYMDDGPFGPVTWLDYSKGVDLWQDQVNWASDLGSELTVTLDPGYTSSIDWSTGWRLPEVDESKINLDANSGYEGPDETGYHDYLYGFNMLNSEMGYLFYEELGNPGYRLTDGTYNYSGSGLENKGDFENIKNVYHWSGTEASTESDSAWFFAFNYGYQKYQYSTKYQYEYNALAVHSGYVNAVPVPGTILLLASGLAGIGALGRRTRRIRG